MEKENTPDCPNCRRPVPKDAGTCPRCGALLVTWEDILSVLLAFCIIATGFLLSAVVIRCLTSVAD